MTRCTECTNNALNNALRGCAFHTGFDQARKNFEILDDVLSLAQFYVFTPKKIVNDFLGDIKISLGNASAHSSVQLVEITFPRGRLVDFGDQRPDDAGNVCIDLAGLFVGI